MPGGKQREKREKREKRVVIAFWIAQKVYIRLTGTLILAPRHDLPCFH
jgi:hypothetical protein